MELNPLLAQKLTLPSLPGQPAEIEGPKEFLFGSIGEIITKAIPLVLAFAGFGLLLMIIRAGFTLLTSAGDAKQMESGKQRLTYAIVGFLVIFTAYWLVQIAGRIFGIAEVSTIFQ